MIWTLILKHWRVVGSFLAMAAFLGWVTWQSQKITTLKSKLAVSKASIASYEESLSALQADTKAKIQALEEEKNRQIERTKTQERLLGRIEGASNEQDAPVAPVLRDTIERLYGREPNTNKSD